MSEEPTNNQRAALNKPFMLGYTVSPSGDSDKSYWSKIGVAWAHKDGQGFNVRMDALPVDGKLVLRCVPENHDDTGELFEREPV
ncbi:MAG: hypothetical protein ACRBB0_25945 [Pelagimonas sp.]|uniref:hypothetical protein n=1 Tax=Pelagimonas sp. TaxID=2073170 RepID=UPI003D6AF18D